MKLGCFFFVTVALAQPPDFGPPGFGPTGRGGPPGMQKREILKEYDKDGDGRLNAKERAAARAAMAQQPQFGRGRGFGRGGQQFSGPATPGPKLTSEQVKHYGTEPLFDLKVLRTFFLEFEEADWEKELADFHGTDVEVPCKLTVDGKEYPGVGVHFHGSSSYMMVPEGRKRSLTLAIDFTKPDQRLYGVRTLHLLNSHEDPSFLHTVLFSQAAGSYIPTPKANYVRVVINGESWGIYVNQEQYNTDFLRDHLGTTKGARWKTPGSPNGRAGLNYLGEDPAAYKRIYEIKSKDDPKSWAALINLCKVLSQTPQEKVESTLAPLLDIDGALKFLALEKTLINNDGYYMRASDYNLYLDTNGKFHVYPHDMNETFIPPGGPGMGGGRRFGGGGSWGEPQAERELDPFANSTDTSKPLMSKLLAVPVLRQRYLALVQQVAREWLDWKKLEPLARQYQSLIADDVKADTRKLYSTEAFLTSLTEDTPGEGGGPFGGRTVALKTFVEKRQAYLLSYPGAAQARQ